MSETATAPAPKPYYWHQTEQHKAAEKVQTALFEYQELVLKLDPQDDETWRRIYGMRCDVGRLEHIQQLRANYKDGWCHDPVPEDEETGEASGVSIPR